MGSPASATVVFPNRGRPEFCARNELNNLLGRSSVFLTFPIGATIRNVSGSGIPDLPVNETSANSALQWEWVEEDNGGLWC